MEKGKLMDHKPYQAQHNYHSKQTIQPDLDQRIEPWMSELVNLCGILAVTTLLLTIIGIIVSFK